MKKGKIPGAAYCWLLALPLYVLNLRWLFLSLRGGYSTFFSDHTLLLSLLRDRYYWGLVTLQLSMLIPMAIVTLCLFLRANPIVLGISLIVHSLWYSGVLFVEWRYYLGVTGVSAYSLLYALQGASCLSLLIMAVLLMTPNQSALRKAGALRFLPGIFYPLSFLMSIPMTLGMEHALYPIAYLGNLVLFLPYIVGLLLLFKLPKQQPQTEE
jgi:hypothetical protein